MACKLSSYQEEYKASAPGSLMLIGEHAVLYGGHALVCAVDQRILATLRPRQDKIIKLISNMAGEIAVDLAKLNPTLVDKMPEWRFVLAAILSERKNIKSGFELRIESQQKDPIGLGSSAAVSVVTLGLLWCLLKKNWIGESAEDKSILCKKVIALIRSIQGRASGADVAASVFGGVLSYKMRPLQVEKLALSLPLTVVYSGHKVTTKDVLENVAIHAKRAPKAFTLLYETMAAVASQAGIALQNGNIVVFGELMNVYHGLLDALGVNNAVLSELVYALRSDENIYGAKISGAGMGDCVIALGESVITFPQNKAEEEKGVRTIAAEVTERGLCVE